MVIDRSELIARLEKRPFIPLLRRIAIKKPIYLVGGFVRDLLLGRRSKDVDVLCEGDGIEVAKIFSQLIGKEEQAVKVFKHFGTAMLSYQGGSIEFVGARKESYQPHSRKPFVQPATLIEDLRRRDFTINSLAIDLSPNHFGKLIDPWGGLDDLAKRRLQTPLDPALTFSDDPLRMLRAIRFATQLQFTLPDNLKRAIQQKVNRLAIISKERIHTELNQIILTDQPSIGFHLLDQTHLLNQLLPELTALKGVETIQGKRHKDNFLHTLKVLDNVAKRSPKLWLRWAALLHDIAKPRTKRFDPKIGFSFHGHEEVGARMVPTIFRRLKLPLQKAMPYVQKLVRLHLRPISLVKEVSDSAIRRLVYEAGEELNDLMILCRADITSKNLKKIATYMQNFSLVEKKIDLLQEKDYIRRLQPVLDGNEIMQIFDLPPGKEVGRLKAILKEAILDGVVPNQRAALYPFLLKKGSEMNLIVKHDK